MLSPDRFKFRRRNFARLLLGLLGGVLLFWLLVLYAFYWEPQRLVVETREIKLENWHAAHHGLRIALLTDLHVSNHSAARERLREIVKRTNAAHPDLILLGGDFANACGIPGESSLPPELLGEILQELHAPLGVFAVLGNHDWWNDGASIRSALEARGITVLENEFRELQLHGETFRLVGLPDAMTRRQYYVPARLPDNTKPNVLLSHSPDFFNTPGLHGELMIAGHTHGGQVRMPWFGAITIPTQYGRRYDQGHFRQQRRQLYISRGLGTSVLPLRVYCPPELSILTLQSAGR